MSRAVRGRNRTLHPDVIRGDAITSRTISPSLAAAQFPPAGRTSAVWRSTAGVETPEEAASRSTLARETVAALAAHSWRNPPHQLDAVDVGQHQVEQDPRRPLSVRTMRGRTYGTPVMSGA